MIYKLGAEKMFLGGAMRSPDIARLVVRVLRPEDFDSAANLLIYSAINDLYQGYKPINVNTVADELRRQGNLEKAGGVAYITFLADFYKPDIDFEQCI